MKTAIDLNGVTAQELYDFLLNCTDRDYQEWWEGTHLAYHTVRRHPGGVGNVLVVDEFVGEYRLKGQAIVTKLVPNREMVWQIKKFVKLPAWLTIRFEDIDHGVKLIHIVTIGFQGIGAIFDPLLRLYLDDDFERQLEKHAQQEFPMLAAMLLKRRARG